MQPASTPTPPYHQRGDSLPGAPMPVLAPGSPKFRPARTLLTALFLTGALWSSAGMARGHHHARHARRHRRHHALQCVPYARRVSGIDIHGNADLWWRRAVGHYQRGHAPERGAVFAFRATDAMPSGHVAVVKRVIDSRHLLLDHANWSAPGRVDHHAMAVDVSSEGDWSEVRVWYDGTHAMGTRVNPTYGFIYKDAPPQRQVAIGHDDLRGDSAVLNQLDSGDTNRKTDDHAEASG